jgi:hypothetical protein
MRLGSAAVRPLVTVLLLAAAACGADGAVGPEEALAPFVGDWNASRFVVKSKANPEIAPDLIADLDSEFSVHVEPSGGYTATLLFQEAPIVEIGQLEVDGQDLVFHVAIPEARTTRSRFTFAGSRLTLVGDSEFDYNFDGTPEPAEVTIELIKR